MLGRSHASELLPRAGTCTAVTVFGFPAAREAAVLAEFQQFGEITSYNVSGNTMHLEYATAAAAACALSRDRQTVNGAMLGVFPATADAGRLAEVSMARSFVHVPPVCCSNGADLTVRQQMAPPAWPPAAAPAADADPPVMPAGLVGLAGADNGATPVVGGPAPLLAPARPGARRQQQVAPRPAPGALHVLQGWFYTIAEYLFGW